MRTYSIIKMTNLSPVHIGSGHENYDSAASGLHSDTLTAALAAMRAQQGKTDDLKDFLSSFVLSSAFPFRGNRLFLPKPQGQLDITVKGKSEFEYRKNLKKIKYVESSLWQELAKGKGLEIKEGQIHSEYLLSDNTDIGAISKSQVVERVSVPRNGEDASPFFFEWKYFDKEAGLYCLTDATGELLGEIESLFSLLGESGIGTDKSVGGGKFDVEVSTISIALPEDADSLESLSLFIPDEKDMTNLDLENSRYSLCLRGGFMAGSSNDGFRHLRKKSVYAFGAGSVFPGTKPFAGKIVDLTPDWNDPAMHKVYRSGRPFMLPIKTNAL